MKRFDVGASGRLDAVLSEVVDDLSRSRAVQLVRDGQVTVDGAVEVRPARRLRKGMEVTVVVPAPTAVSVVAQDLPLDIVYQDPHLAVINKAAGRVVHPAPGHPDGTLVNALLFHLDDLSGVGGELRPGIVHRLDMGTTGLLVVAKDDRAHTGLAAQFADHSAGRRYLAICAGSPPADAGTVESLLGRHPKDRVRMASGEQGRRAVTHWTVLDRGEGVTLMEARLETGRTHQVRVHLSEQGWPIIGDATYNRRRRLPAATPADRAMLHAWQLAFVHPHSGEDLVFQAPPPEDFTAMLTTLGLVYRPQIP